MNKFSDNLKYALKGLKETLIYERNFKIMLLFAFGAVFLMLYFPTSRTEKAVVVTAIFAVLTLELVNSVIERLLDFFHPEYSNEVRIIKDLMAAIVLLTGIGAAVISLIVFWPHIF